MKNEKIYEQGGRQIWSEIRGLARERADGGAEVALWRRVARELFFFALYFANEATGLHRESLQMMLRAIYTLISGKPLDASPLEPLRIMNELSELEELFEAMAREAGAVEAFYAAGPSLKAQAIEAFAAQARASDARELAGPRAVPGGAALTSRERALVRLFRAPLARGVRDAHGEDVDAMLDGALFRLKFGPTYQVVGGDSSPLAEACGVALGVDGCVASSSSVVELALALQDGGDVDHQGEPEPAASSPAASSSSSAVERGGWYVGRVAGVDWWSAPIHAASILAAGRVVREAFAASGKVSPNAGPVRVFGRFKDPAQIAAYLARNGDAISAGNQPLIAAVVRALRGTSTGEAATGSSSIPKRVASLLGVAHQGELEPAASSSSASSGPTWADMFRALEQTEEEAAERLRLIVELSKAAKLARDAGEASASSSEAEAAESWRSFSSGPTWADMFKALEQTPEEAAERLRLLLELSKAVARSRAAHEAPASSPAAVLYPSSPAAPRHRCSGKHCPGYPWPASERAHPESCAFRVSNSPSSAPAASPTAASSSSAVEPAAFTMTGPAMRAIVVDVQGRGVRIGRAMGERRRDAGKAPAASRTRDAKYQSSRDRLLAAAMAGREGRPRAVDAGASSPRVAGRAVTPAQKIRAIGRILDVWIRVADLRLGQLIEMALHGDNPRIWDVFDVEDETIAGMIEAFGARVAPLACSSSGSSASSSSSSSGVEAAASSPASSSSSGSSASSSSSGVERRGWYVGSVDRVDWRSPHINASSREEARAAVLEAFAASGLACPADPLVNLCGPFEGIDALEACLAKQRDGKAGPVCPVCSRCLILTFEAFYSADRVVCFGCGTVIKDREGIAPAAVSSSVVEGAASSPASRPVEAYVERMVLECLGDDELDVLTVAHKLRTTEKSAGILLRRLHDQGVAEPGYFGGFWRKATPASSSSSVVEAAASSPASPTRASSPASSSSSVVEAPPAPTRASSSSGSSAASSPPSRASSRTPAACAAWEPEPIHPDTVRRVEFCARCGWFEIDHVVPGGEIVIGAGSSAPATSSSSSVEAEGLTPAEVRAATVPGWFFGYCIYSGWWSPPIFAPSRNHATDRLMAAAYACPQGAHPDGGIDFYSRGPFASEGLALTTRQAEREDQRRKFGKQGAGVNFNRDDFGQPCVMFSPGAKLERCMDCGWLASDHTTTSPAEIPGDLPVKS
jgi:hypothetical protein